MSLDDKLREIVDILTSKLTGNYRKELTDVAVAQIKQAFADEGWVQVLPADTTDEEFNAQGTINGTAFKIKHGYMTGQEWYDRFLDEYVKLEGQPDGGTAMPRSNAKKAAKKAAGL